MLQGSCTGSIPPKAALGWGGFRDDKLGIRCGRVQDLKMIHFRVAKFVDLRVGKD